ncbi:electron transfer flavoprotein subunit alpha/FixB family protein [Chloroflexota bacterium]
MTENSEVLICGEQEEGKITTITKELLGAGRKLAGELSGQLSALILGSGIRGSGEEAIVYGADKVYLVDDPLLSQYNPESYTTVITQVCQKEAPSIVLLGHTTMGRDVAGRVAYRLGCFACTDCVKLDIDPDSKLLVQTRSVYGGNAMAVVGSKDIHPQFATIRPRAVAPLDPDNSRKGEIKVIKVEIDASTIRTRLVDTVKQEAEEAKLEEAEVIVAGGGGIGSAEGFELLRDLAKIWGGAVGITTIPYDEGWVPSHSSVIAREPCISPLQKRGRNPFFCSSVP